MARDITRSYSLPDSVIGLGFEEAVYIIEGDFDPTITTGQPAPLGSLFLRTDVPGLYLKDSAPDTGWTLQGTTTASFTNRQQLVFVGKHGSASPASNGRIPDDPWDTFSNALTYVNSQTPSSGNRFTILCQDSGDYSESFTVPSFVSIEARDAVINGTITTSDNSETTIREVSPAINTSAVIKTAGSGSSRVNAEVLRATGTGDTITTQAGETGVFIVNARQVFTENGSAVVDNSTAPAGHIHVEIEDIYITGTGFGLDRDSSTGLILGRVAHILELGAGVGNGTAIKIDSGRVDLQAGFIDTTTAYSVSGSGTLRLLVSRINGARTQTAGTASVDVIEADILRWITIDDTDSPYTPRRIGYIAIDTTNGPVTLNLPSPPSDGDNISFQDARNTFETNNLTIDAGVGNLIDDGGAGSQTVVLDVDGTSGIFIFNGSLGRWTFTRIQEEVAFSPSNLIYVTKNGSDVIGDGSFSNPFLTVKRGVQEAATRVATTPSPTTVKVLDGVYDEVNPIDMTFSNSHFVQLQGEQEFAVIIRPTVDSQRLFDMTSGDVNDGPALNRITINANNLPTFKSNNQAGVYTSGPGRFVIDKVNIMDCGVGIDSGNGVSTNQETVYDFATITGCNTGIDAKGDGIQACQVCFFRDNDVGLRASSNVRVEIGNYASQGANFGAAAYGVGFEVNDNAEIVATSGTISNHVTGLSANDNSNTILLTTSFAGNTTEFNQVDATADITIQGALSKTKQLITDGSIVSLNYIDTETGDYIVGNADATGDPGKEFRVRDVDGRIAIGDNATNENIATGTVGASRSLNLIDENGNFRIWRFTTAGGEDPAVEWIKGVNASLPDSVGDTAITNIDAATDTITIDVSGTDYNDPFDTPYGINRLTLAERAFPAGREVRINGTASNNGDFTVSSASYTGGSPDPQTIDIVVTADITVSEGAGGEVVWGGGAGRPDGVSTYVGDPGAAVGAGVGNVRWDMFLQEDDYFVIRRRTSGGGSTPNEKVRIYQDHSEWLGSTQHDDGDNSTILYLSTVGAAANYIQIDNALTGNGPEIQAQGTDTNVNIEMIPKGTGTVVVPVGYDANLVAQSLITKNHIDLTVQAEVDAIELASGGVYAADGTYDGTVVDAALSLVTGSTDWLDAIVQINDSISTQYFHAHNNTTTQALTGTFVTAIIGTDIVSDSIYSNTNGEVTVNRTGRFAISYDIGANSTGGRSTMECVLQVNAVNVPGSFAYGYHRNTASGEDTASARVIVNLTSGQVVRVRIREVAGGIVTLSNASRLTIEEIY